MHWTGEFGLVTIIGILFGLGTVIFKNGTDAGNTFGITGISFGITFLNFEFGTISLKHAVRKYNAEIYK
jgi:hypothetical protein